jgi:hypothetical protein
VPDVQNSAQHPAPPTRDGRQPAHLYIADFTPPKEEE